MFPSQVEFAAPIAAPQFSDVIGDLLAHRHLDATAMAAVVGALIDGCWTQAQGGGFLAALATKGETIGELVGTAQALRDRSLRAPQDRKSVV